MKPHYCLILTATALTGCASTGLRESGTTDEAIANTYKKPNADGLEIYYANRYQSQANKKRKEADSMTLSDETIDRAIYLIFDGLFKENK